MSEEKAQQLMQQMQMLETYFTDLSQRESTLYNVLREATAAIQSIKSLNLKSESEALVPVGMGSFVKTKISSSDKIVLNIGAGISLEKDSTSAINYLEARIKEIEVAIQDTSAKKHDAATQLEQGRNQINQLIHQDSQTRSD
ncbi:MAG: prefoldin subunit alpha [Nitrosopumilus sp.]|nr:prefoldin subunit alpha [Nitrosopumilus sp.]MDH3386238.1 prefoldin subunit alpha [Nitrosopumilus sp.]